MSSCRVCLGDSDLIEIFGPDEDIASNVMLFASVQIIEGDDLPQHICNLCKIELDICLGFKNKCEATDETLKKSWSNIKVDPLEGTSGSYNWEREKVDLDSESYSESFSEAEATDIFCEQCNIHFPSQMFLNIHIEKKHKHTCNICDLRFSYRKLLFEHLKYVHKIKTPKSEKSKQCHICGICFNYKAELNRHFLTHSNTKVFKCKQCDKYFSSRVGWNKHRARHSNLRTYSYPTRSKTFVHQSNVRDHTNQKRYKCHICKKMFKAKRTLALHLKIHNSERDLSCFECEKAFTNKYGLCRHGRAGEYDDGTYPRPNSAKGEISGEALCV